MRSVFTDLGVLFDMPFPIEAMSPKWAQIRIGLVVPSAIGTLERVGARLALLGF